jgi:nucleoside phosphorylase
MTPKRPTTRLDFEIAIICALRIESEAVRQLFDRDWEDEDPPYDKAQGDPNAYSTGLVGRHNVVLAHMPNMGKATAATVASNCRTSFPNIKLALVVGVCGVVPTVPNTDKEIVLGDVILSNGVIQYDLGRQFPEHFARKGTLLDSLGRPNIEIRALLGKLESFQDRKKLGKKLASHLEELQKETEIEAEYPGIAHDKLFDPTYRHVKDGQTCEECRCSGELIPRHRLSQGTPQPALHFGLMASGDTVMKSGKDRDDIALREGIIGFEMESAGMWDTFPCIVIKGACDYADSHKTKKWQRYAAATAAACTKAFLEYWVPSVTTSAYRIMILMASNVFANMLAIGHVVHEYTLAFSLSEVTEVGQFVGRKDELAHIHSSLDKADGRRTAVIHGLGGIGKTQLAIAYLKAHHTNYSATIWLNASDVISLQQSFSRAAENILRQYPTLISIKTAMESRDPDSIIQAVKGWLDEPKNNCWLLVFDNYDNPKLEKEEKSDNDEETSNRWSEEQPVQEATMASKAYDIRTFFPNNYHGAIIITTRSSTVRIGQPIFLKKFTKVNDSLEVLRSNSQRDDIDNGKEGEAIVNIEANEKFKMMQPLNLHNGLKGYHLLWQPPELI